MSFLPILSSIFSQSTESSTLLKPSPMSTLLFYLPENALKKLLFYSGIDHTTTHHTGLHPISVFNFILTEICFASYSSSIISRTCIVCLAGSQIASTCFKEVAPSTAYSNRNEYNSSSLIWFSTGHNFIIIFLFVYIEKNTERFRSNSFNKIYMGNIPDPHSSLSFSPPNTSFLLHWHLLMFHFLTPVLLPTNIILF